MSAQDGSTPVDAGPISPLPPGKASCSPDLATDPDNCGYCTHRCLPGNACVGGVCEASLVATASSIDSVAFAVGSVLVGDATSGKIRLCARSSAIEACQVVASGTGVGSALAVVADQFTYFDKQSSHVTACSLAGCNVQSRDLGVVDVGMGAGTTLASGGTWVFWTTPTAVTTAPLVSTYPKETDPRLAKTTRLSVLYDESDDSTTLAGATSTGAWALRLDDSGTALPDGKKRAITTTTSNDVAVDTSFIWSAQNDGLYRAPLTKDAATKVHDGAFTAVASSQGVAFGLVNGTVMRIKEGEPDAVLATNATRVFADDTDDFVYFVRGAELLRVPR